MIAAIVPALVLCRRVRTDPASPPPVHQIKLDRSFVPDGGSDAIATVVVQMARAFGLAAVAEGIETAEQAAQLTGLGYEKAQGFHFARPMPAADLHDRFSVSLPSP
ncbi:hypothetical protein Ait01nite_027130 [Actinoplanes italicus]|nr:hypothetical protein Ait01nite_027130 [Actinoplanes italicus]